MRILKIKSNEKMKVKLKLNRKVNMNVNRKVNINVNRKGGAELYFLMIATFIFAVIFLINMHRMDTTLQTVGENSVKLINTFETSERLFFYMDSSVDLAVKYAEKSVVEKSGYMEKKFKGEIQESGCGLLAYPIIDTDKSIDECFPDYQTVLKVEFVRQFNSLLLKYTPFDIDTSQLNTVVKDNGKAIQISVNSISDMGIPVYSYIESYYRAADKTDTIGVDLSAIEKTDAGYWVSKSYLTLVSFRRTIEPTKIVLHDTQTKNIPDTYTELKTGTYNYNYVIDQAGMVFLFTPENRYTLSSGCKVTSKTCMMENTDQESISIALINMDAKAHPAAQIAALNKLIAEITIRNPSIELDANSILLNREIETSRKDPALDLQKEAVINAAKSARDTIIKSGTIVWPATSVGNKIADKTTSDASGTNSNPDNLATGNAVNLIKMDEEKCFNNVRTTLYYTPSYDDHGGLWSSGKLPKGGSYCNIPQSERGFYEEVKCQGSGVYDGKVYHTSTIGKTLAESTPLGDHITGITSTGKDPMPKRTVAADPTCPGFKYGSKLYIYWDAESTWNGYYVVEDTGGAFKGRCDKMDIYAGVGQVALSAAKGEVTDNAKICVLDKNFKMPDPDFSASSTYIDPITGDYNVKYVHTASLEDIKTLFDNSKEVLNQMITSCGDAGNIASKDMCLSAVMKRAENLPLNLKVEYCDQDANGIIKDIKEVNQEIYGAAKSTGTAKIVGYITQINIDNQDIFVRQTASDLNGAQATDGQIITPQTTPAMISPIDNQYSFNLPAIQQGAQKDVLVTVNDGTAEIVIKLTGDALQWVDYDNKESPLYAEGGFLQRGDRLLMNIDIDVSNGEVSIDKFDNIMTYPENLEEQEVLKIVRTLGDCATSTGDCMCTIPAAKMLAPVDITGDNGKNRLTYTTAYGDKVSLNLPFTVKENILSLDPSAAMNVRMSNGDVVFNSAATDACVPKRTYRYICSTLIGHEDLGTAKFTLKI